MVRRLVRMSTPPPAEDQRTVRERVLGAVGDPAGVVRTLDGGRP